MPRLASRPPLAHVAGMTEETLKNIALLIDADNTTPKGIDPVLTVMAELGQVNIKRAYGNFAKNNLANWDKITHKYGIRPQQQFDLTAGKNATDMAMTIDAIDLLYQGKVDGFGIMSSDSKIAGNRSSFDVRNYGYKRLSDLFEAIDEFKVERRDNSGMYVKRLR